MYNVIALESYFVNNNFPFFFFTNYEVNTYRRIEIIKKWKIAWISTIGLYFKNEFYKFLMRYRIIVATLSKLHEFDCKRLETIII